MEFRAHWLSLVVMLVLHGCGRDLGSWLNDRRGGDGGASQADTSSPEAPPAEAGAAEPKREPCVPLEIVGIYQARNDHSGNNHPRGRFSLTVERPGRQVLVLSSHEPIDWEIIAVSGAIIDRVVASGYYRQHVSAPSGTVVETFSHEESSGQYVLGYEWNRSKELVQWAETHTGKSVNAFHGCYDMRQLTLHADLTATTDCDTGGGYATSSVVNPTPCDTNVDPVRFPCVGADGAGAYRLKLCDVGPGRGQLVGANRSCLDALENCRTNQALNPSQSITCNWTQGDSTHPLLTDEKTPGVCAPYSGTWATSNP